MFVCVWGFSPTFSFFTLVFALPQRAYQIPFLAVSTSKGALSLLPRVLRGTNPWAPTIIPTVITNNTILILIIQATSFLMNSSWESNWEEQGAYQPYQITSPEIGQKALKIPPYRSSNLPNYIKLTSPKDNHRSGTTKLPILSNYTSSPEDTTTSIG